MEKTFQPLKGLVNNLPVEKIEGKIYFTTDAGEVYFDVDNDTRVQVSAGKLSKTENGITTAIEISDIITSKDEEPTTDEPIIDADTLQGKTYEDIIDSLPPGPVGESGEDGKSAYQYAVEAGYDKTDDQFSKDLANIENKINKLDNATTNNFPMLTSDGQLRDSGKKSTDFAPSGFGLGENKVREAPTPGNANSIDATGFYLVNSQTPDSEFGNSALEHIAFSSDYAFQIAYLLESTTSFGYGVIQRRSKERGIWHEWEYDNPILDYGVEYKTTLRYHRKPVYVKLIQFGALPNATVSSVAHKIINLESVVSVSGSTSDKKNIPTMNYGGGGSSNDIIDVLIDPINITIYASRNRSTATANILIKYTKTTD